MKKFKQIMSLLLVILIIGLYITTLILAIMGNEITEQWFMASLFATGAVPVFLYVVTWLMGLVSKKEE